MLGYLMDQSMRIENATKKPTTVIPFSDYGVNLIATSILVSKDTIATKGDLVRRFMAAATRAVEDAEKDPAAAVDAMLKANAKAGDRASLIKGLELTVPLYHTDDTKNLRPFQVSPANVKDFDRDARRIWRPRQDRRREARKLLLARLPAEVSGPDPACLRRARARRRHLFPTVTARRPR